MSSCLSVSSQCAEWMQRLKFKLKLWVKTHKLTRTVPEIVTGNLGTPMLHTRNWHTKTKHAGKLSHTGLTSIYRVSLKWETTLYHAGTTTNMRSHTGQPGVRSYYWIYCVYIYIPVVTSYPSASVTHTQSAKRNHAAWRELIIFHHRLFNTRLGLISPSNYFGCFFHWADPIVKNIILYVQ